MKIIERTNSRGQIVTLRSASEFPIPLQCTNEFGPDGYKTVGWGDCVRVFEDRKGNQNLIDYMNNFPFYIFQQFQFFVRLLI